MSYTGCSRDKALKTEIPFMEAYLDKWIKFNAPKDKTQTGQDTGGIKQEEIDISRSEKLVKRQYSIGDLVFGNVHDPTTKVGKL